MKPSKHTCRHFKHSYPCKSLCTSLHLAILDEHKIISTFPPTKQSPEGKIKLNRLQHIIIATHQSNITYKVQQSIRKELKFWVSILSSHLHLADHPVHPTPDHWSTATKQITNSSKIHKQVPELKPTLPSASWSQRTRSTLAVTKSSCCLLLLFFLFCANQDLCMYIQWGYP